MNNIIFNISRVIEALNTITVSGKSNLANLAGSIGLLEDVVSNLKEMERTESKKETQD